MWAHCIACKVQISTVGATITSVLASDMIDICLDKSLTRLHGLLPYVLPTAINI